MSFLVQSPDMPEQAMPKTLRGISGTDCRYSELCKAKVLCSRIRYDIVAAEVPVNPESEDLSKAELDLLVKMKEWSNVSEESCTRKDNYLKGEKVTVYRVGSYATEQVFI